MVIDARQIKKSTRRRSDGAPVELSESSPHRLNDGNGETKTKTKIHVNPHPMTMSEVSILLRTASSSSCSNCDVNANEMLADASSSATAAAHFSPTVAEASIDKIAGTTDGESMLWPPDEAFARRHFRLRCTLSTVTYRVDETFRCHSRPDARITGCSHHSPSTPPLSLSDSFSNGTKKSVPVHQDGAAATALQFALSEVGLCLANDNRLF